MALSAYFNSLNEISIPQRMLPMREDVLDGYRLEYNQILARNANLSCGVTQDKYKNIYQLYLRG